MNILHMKYAAEVAKAGSINKASEILLVAQPNLSRSIKELEADLGITIFDRTAKGMFLTPEGEEFIERANQILRQIDEVEKMYKENPAPRQQFSICVPRASYISDAFACFSNTLDGSPAELFYKETNSLRAINKVLNSDCKLGIIRYSDRHDKYFKTMLSEKGIEYELVSYFHYVLIMNEKSPLAKKDSVGYDDLKDFIEIAHADPYVPTLSLSQIRKEELPDDIKRRIFVFERASQFDILSENPDTFMWVSPTPDKLLKKYGLVKRECSDNIKLYRDVLIRKKDYNLTELDRRFIDELCASKRRHFG